MKLGNTSFNPHALKGSSKEDFIRCYQGKLDGIDINEAWNQIQIANGDNEETKIKKPLSKR